MRSNDVADPLTDGDACYQLACRQVRRSDRGEGPPVVYQISLLLCTCLCQRNSTTEAAFECIQDIMEMDGEKIPSKDSAEWRKWMDDDGYDCESFELHNEPKG